MFKMLGKAFSFRRSASCQKSIGHHLVFAASGHRHCQSQCQCTALDHWAALLPSGTYLLKTGRWQLINKEKKSERAKLVPRGPCFTERRVFEAVSSEMNRICFVPVMLSLAKKLLLVVHVVTEALLRVTKAHSLVDNKVLPALLEKGLFMTLFKGSHLLRDSSFSPAEHENESGCQRLKSAALRGHLGRPALINMVFSRSLLFSRSFVIKFSYLSPTKK